MYKISKLRLQHQGIYFKHKVKSFNKKYLGFENFQYGTQFVIKRKEKSKD